MVLLMCNNLDVTYLSINFIFHACIKHAEINYYFVYYKVVKKKIQIIFISFKEQLIDVFSKHAASPLCFSLFAVQVSCGYPIFSFRRYIMEYVII